LVAQPCQWKGVTNREADLFQWYLGEHYLTSPLDDAMVRWAGLGDGAVVVSQPAAWQQCLVAAWKCLYGEQ
jgi:hypothetical protein